MRKKTGSRKFQVPARSAHRKKPAATFKTPARVGKPTGKQIREHFKKHGLKPNVPAIRLEREALRMSESCPQRKNI